MLVLSILVELEFRVLVFKEGGKPENPGKNPRSKARTNNKLNQQLTPGQNRTPTTLVGGKRSHHYAIAAPLCASENQFLIIYQCD